MTAISILNAKVDKVLYDKIMKDVGSGKNNEILRFILNQKNWIRHFNSWIKYGDGTPQQDIEDVVSSNQSKRLINTYITAIYLLRDYAQGGTSNLNDTRTADIMGHRGWYMHDYILPPILKRSTGYCFLNKDEKAAYDGRRLEDKYILDIFYKRMASQSTPEFGVVQSILMGGDFDMYMNQYKQNKFVTDGYTCENYMKDLEAVCDNIINGRSIVLMEPNTIAAFNRFGVFYCDKKNPYFKKEYAEKARAAAVVVQGDWNVEKARLAALRQPRNNNYGGHGYGRS